MAEEIDLRVKATTSDAQQNLGKLNDVLKQMGLEVEKTSKSTQTAGGSAGGFLDTLKQYYNNASMGATGLGGLVNVIGSINPVAGIALNGLSKLISAIGSLKEEALAALNNAQSLTINLESLAAQELVKAGQFENATDALDTAKIAAAGLLKELQKIGLESPFENKTVVATFQQGMAYGFNAEQALKLTRASLDMAAGLGKSGAEMQMIGMVMGQIRSTGKLLTQDVRQLTSRGIDLAGMLQNQLGVSVEQFNAGLQSGKYSMDDLLNVFSEFSQSNFGGAAERMARTWQGIQATLSDLKETAFITLLKQPFDKVTAVLADGLDVLKEFVMQSGILEKVGAGISGFVDNVIALGKGIIEWVKPALDVFTAGPFQQALQDAQIWIRMISLNLKQVGEAIWNLVKPAIDWLQARIASFDWSVLGKQLQDTVNTIGSTIYYLVETIRKILTGNSDAAFMPLRAAIVNVLTWAVVTWDRFAADAVTWGWNLVVQLANGIINAAKSVLSQAMTYLGNIIGLFIKPGSPPKQGPLSHIVEWGRGIINTFVQSFKTADFGLLKDALSPIQQSLQDAVSFGNLDEAESKRIFAGVRDDVAQLISVYRQTGEISDSVLSNISAKLGEGGTELTKYLRLQLKYQQAQEALGGIANEVAAAQKKGFVSKDLAAKLKAAQATADAAKDELDWQKEYLGLQKDSVDIQLQLVKALEKLNKALGGTAKAAGAEKTPTGGGADVAKATPFTSNLMDLAVPADIGAGANQLELALGGVSEEFQKAREKVDSFVSRVEEFIKIPLPDKVKLLADLVGIDFDALKENVDGIFDALDPKKLVTHIGNFIKGLPAQIGFIISSAWNTLIRKMPVWTEMLWIRIMRLFEDLMARFRSNSTSWGANLGKALGTVFGFMFNLVFSEIPQFVFKIVGGLLVGLYNVAKFLFTEGPRLAASWWESLKAMFGVIIDYVIQNGPTWAATILEFLRGFFVNLIISFIENGPEWYKDLAVAALQFIDEFKAGLSKAWDLLTYMKNKVLAWITGILFNFGTWIINLYKVGKTFVEKIKEGITNAWDMVLWIGGKITEMVQKLIEGAGDTLAGLVRLGEQIVEKIKEGVTDGWDFATWISGMLVVAGDSLLGTDGGWMSSIVKIGTTIVDKLKQGIKDAWDGFISWWKGLLGGLNPPSSSGGNVAQALRTPNIPTISGGLSQAGAGAIGGEITRMRQLLGDAALNVAVSQYYTFGDVVFPNVVNGRDAQSVENTLAQLTIRGTLEARARGNG